MPQPRLGSGRHSSPPQGDRIVAVRASTLPSIAHTSPDAKSVHVVSTAQYPSLLVLACAVLLDRMVRLPTALHPVAWFGRFALWWIERAPVVGRVLPFGIGLVLVIALPLFASALAGCVLALSFAWHPVATGLLQVLLVYACVCLYGLLDAAWQLELALRDRGLPAARERLAWLCSRDASRMDETGLVNGTVESLAENLSDSVVAPLFFLCCFGLPGAIAYRAINTLDAMIGYHGRYEWLGKATARVDDLVNLVPARLTAWLLWLAAVSCKHSQRLSLRRGFAIWRADRARTPSPNGGQPMAMAAGLLGVRLDKPGAYVLGAQLASPTAADLLRARVLCGRAGLVAIALAAWVLWQLGAPLV